jgi:hypothetical protein
MARPIVLAAEGGVRVIDVLLSPGACHHLGSAPIILDNAT